MSEFDPILKMDVDVAFVQPFNANKTYLCPACGHTIEIGVGHFVAVPIGAPDLRRHWHRSCWENRSRRRPGR
jgi:hypothetical protein